MIYTDYEIDQWMRERKELPNDWQMRIWNDKELVVRGEKYKYKIIINDKYHTVPSFSVVLIVYPTDDNYVFRLRRYDSPHGKHKNQLENTYVGANDFHIHIATERYQKECDDDMDKYAETTDRFNDIPSALKCLIKDANFQEGS